jgi:Fe-S-cluster containining protein
MDYPKKLNKIYDSLPSLDCTGCWGECCVSPTMTAPEFILMMNTLLKMYPQEKVKEYLMAPSREHKFWEGNHYCRFQNEENGRCEVYPGRALACRLHGHEALRAFEDPDMVFCDKNPDKTQALKQDHLNGHLSTMRDVLDSLPIKYEAPWFLASMNLDCWLDFYFEKNISDGRLELEALHDFILKRLELPAVSFKLTTTLKGKINHIEKAYYFIQEEKFDQALKCFIELESDFPSTGSYFLEEAKQCQNWMKDRIALTANQQ